MTSIMYGRHVGFWSVTFVVFAAVLWLLRDILLPFVAGAALRFPLTPLADRLQRLGLNRIVAALLIVGAAVLTLLGLAFLLVPVLLEHGSLLVTRIPGYIKRIQEMVVDSNFPWLNWLAPGDRTKTVSDLVSQAATWSLSFAYSLWSGGKALVSFASILIVMPVVTFYLICDWHRMLEVVDTWIPVRQ